MQKIKPRIDKIIVVEGKDDERAVKTAVSAEVIITGGFSINEAIWELMETAHKGPGLLVFTDPDYAGELIRRKIKERFTGCGNAYLSRKDATKGDDIGIENASPESILKALNKAIRRTAKQDDIFTMEDLVSFGLCGTVEAKTKRDKIGRRLGIGCCNGKAFLARLNSYGITREEFYRHGQALFPGDKPEDNC